LSYGQQSEPGGQSNGFVIGAKLSLAIMQDET